MGNEILLRRHEFELLRIWQNTEDTCYHVTSYCLMKRGDLILPVKPERLTSTLPIYAANCPAQM